MEDSDGLRQSRRGVQGVAAGVPRRELVITQEDDAGTGFRLERRGEMQICKSINIPAHWELLKGRGQTVVPRLLWGARSTFTGTVSPWCDPGQLIGRVEYSAGCKGVG